MSAEAQPGGFDALPEASDPTPLNSTQAGPKGDVTPAPKPTPAAAAASAPRPFKERSKPSRRQRRDRALADQQSATPPAPSPATVIVPEPPKVLTVDDQKELERFKLGVWMTKLFSGSMVVMGFLMLGLYAYQAIATKTVPDMGVMGTVFGHLKEVLVAIFESSK